MATSINDGRVAGPESVGGSYPYSHEIFWNLRLSEQVGYIESDQSGDGLRWDVSLTRLGLPFLPQGSATLTIYNLQGVDLEGHGGRLSGHFPFLNHKLLIQPAVVARFTHFDLGDEDFDVTDVSLRAHWALSRSWVLSGGVSYAITSQEDALSVDISATFKW